MAAQHILVCCHDFSRGGAERVALTLARNWLNAGRQVTFLTGTREGGLIDSLDPRARVVELDPPIPDSLTSRLRLGPAMARVAPGLSPDVVYLIGNYHFGLARSLKRTMPGVPIVSKVSNPLLAGLPGFMRPFAGPFLAHMVRGIDALVYMAPELAREGHAMLPHKSSEVIAEPNLRADQPVLPRDVARNRPRVLAIGRFETQKRMPLAIRAFGELRKTTDAELVILGDGPDRARMERLVRELGLGDCVQMPGFTNHVNAWLATASAFLMSSAFEGYPAAVVEALASDVPVVTTNCSPALESLIPTPVHGCVVDQASPEALASALGKVMTLPESSDGIRPATVAHNDERASADAYLALFDRLAAQRSA